MIESIAYSAQFTESGAALTGTFQPATGITAVVGGNGTGKTFMAVEAPRWLLYGKAALRGSADDYKNTEVSGWVVIRDARYQISRGKKEWIKDADGKLLATGAEKVTERVIELIGYGLDVFDICNAATQGDVQVLGKMKPAERKRMIDKVLRLTSAEGAEKACREEAKGYRREAEALSSTLVPPGEEPRAPHDYSQSTTLRQNLNQERTRRNDYLDLSAKLINPLPPVEPTSVEISSDRVLELEAYQLNRAKIEAKHEQLDRKPAFTKEELDAAEVRLEFAEHGPKPHLTEKQIEVGFEQWRALDSHEHGEEVTCPKCDHIFRTTGETPPPPQWAKSELKTEEQRLRSWQGYDLKAEAPDGPDLTRSQIASCRRDLDAYAEFEKLPAIPPTKAQELLDARQARSAWDHYHAANLSYATAVARDDQLKADAAALGIIRSQGWIDALSDQVRDAEVYEAAVDAFILQKARYTELQDKIAEKLRLADEFRKGAEGVADARAMVKALIAPKISRIATALIRDMTMGKLSNLIVDEDMEISVAGQRLETLSGAGKTVANMALRVAMGQALTARSFPVFLADEIDGDLDASRREATLQAMASLKKHLKQVILVTHRGAEIADYSVNTNELLET